MEERELFIILLDVAKGFTSTIHEVTSSLLNHAWLPPNYVAAFRTIYVHTDSYMDIQEEQIDFKPRRASKKNASAPRSLPFAIVYELLMKCLIAKYPDTFVYVDDIAIIVKDYFEWEQHLTDLSACGFPIAIQFNPNKTEVYPFHRPRFLGATLGVLSR